VQLYFILVYTTIEEAVSKHPDVDVVVNFASFRSAYDVTLDAMRFPCIKTIAIIAEGIPENLTRKLILAANDKNVTIIGKTEFLHFLNIYCNAEIVLLYMNINMVSKIVCMKSTTVLIFINISL
jgi:hypothetical protein